ncbi:MAG TPA: type II toxin-antitoxin system VapC family toxin [Vicinamibacteria bacterium]|nr:type II toxin-antitoxin system VapC family toxin [Vicinamibacteria bacterium]
MGTLIDSSVLVGVERGGLDLDVAVAAHGDESVAIAAITASELLHGVHRAATPSQRLRREGFVERLLAVMPILPFDIVTARIHASLWASLAAKGATVGAHDLLIGATAVAAGYRVVTRDRRSFARIPGLEVVVL